MPAILISILVIVIIINNQQQDTYGELVLTDRELDFGTVPEWGGKVSGEIIAKNIGKQPINITRIQVGYSFIEIEGPTLIQPESEEVLKIHFNPPVLPPDQITETAIFFTDSPKTQHVYFTIKALVQRFATLSAAVCDFGNIEPATDFEKRMRMCVNAPMDQNEIRLMPSGDHRLSWVMEPDVIPNCYVLTISLNIPLKEDEDEVELTHKEDEVELNEKEGGDEVELNQLSRSTPFSALLTVAFPNGRTLTLPVTARVVPPVLAEPESFSLGIVSADTSPSLEFTLSAKSSFTILNINAPTFMQIVVTSVTEDVEESERTYKSVFSVSIDLSDSPNMLREEIIVTTTAASVPIRIPVYGYVKEEIP